jgi:type IV pilus assembly protein PilC
MTTATKTFEYTVRDRKGQRVTGKLDAPTEAALVQKLRGMGYAPLTVREANAGMNRELKIGFGSGVKLRPVPAAGARDPRRAVPEQGARQDLR